MNTQEILDEKDVLTEATKILFEIYWESAFESDELGNINNPFSDNDIEAIKQYEKELLTLLEDNPGLLISNHILTAQEWISVEDRLPEVGEITKCKVDFHRHGSVVQHGVEINAEYKGMNLCINKPMFDIDTYDEAYAEVTHWQPLTAQEGESDDLLSPLIKDVIFDGFRKSLRAYGVFAGQDNNKPLSDFLNLLNSLTRQSAGAETEKRLDLPSPPKAGE